MNQIKQYLDKVEQKDDEEIVSRYHGIVSKAKEVLVDGKPEEGRAGRFFESMGIIEYRTFVEDVIFGTAIMSAYFGVDQWEKCRCMYLARHGPYRDLLSDLEWDVNKISRGGNGEGVYDKMSDYLLSRVSDEILTIFLRVPNHDSDIWARRQIGSVHMSSSAFALAMRREYHLRVWLKDNRSIIQVQDLSKPETWPRELLEIFEGHLTPNFYSRIAYIITGKAMRPVGDEVYKIGAAIELRRKSFIEEEIKSEVISFSVSDSYPESATEAVDRMPNARVLHIENHEYVNDAIGAVSSLEVGDVDVSEVLDLTAVASKNRFENTASYAVMINNLNQDQIVYGTKWDNAYDYIMAVSKRMTKQARQNVEGVLYFCNICKFLPPEIVWKISGYVLHGSLWKPLPSAAIVDPRFWAAKDFENSRYIGDSDIALLTEEGSAYKWESIPRHVSSESYCLLVSRYRVMRGCVTSGDPVLSGLPGTHEVAPLVEMSKFFFYSGDEGCRYSYILRIPSVSVLIVWLELDFGDDVRACIPLRQGVTHSCLNGFPCGFFQYPVRSYLPKEVCYDNLFKQFQFWCVQEWDLRTKPILPSDDSVY